MEALAAFPMIWFKVMQLYYIRVDFEQGQLNPQGNYYEDTTHEYKEK